MVIFLVLMKCGLAQGLKTFEPKISTTANCVNDFHPYFWLVFVQNFWLSLNFVEASLKDVILNTQFPYAFSVKISKSKFHDHQHSKHWGTVANSPLRTRRCESCDRPYSYMSPQRI